MDQRTRRALDVMRNHGGGFVAALAAAWEKADEGNAARLAAAFGHVIEQYSWSQERQVEVECPGCWAELSVRATDHDQQVTCPECGGRWSVTYDAEFDRGLWSGRYSLTPV